MAERTRTGVCVIRAEADDDRVLIRIVTRLGTEAGPGHDRQAVFDDPTEALDAVAEFLSGFTRSSPVR